MVLGENDRFDARLNDWIPVPPEESPLLASFFIHKTVLGKAVEMLFKLPLVEIDVRFEDGTVDTYHMIPTIAETGFLLSPLPETPNDSSSLFSSELESRGRKVAAIRLRDTSLGFYRRIHFSVLLQKFSNTDELP